MIHRVAHISLGSFLVLLITTAQLALLPGEYWAHLMFSPPSASANVSVHGLEVCHVGNGISLVHLDNLGRVIRFSEPLGKVIRE